MKKKDIFTFFDELEQKDDTLKKWGKLYKIEQDLIESIIKARKNKGLSQKEVAEITNLKQPAIARIETGAHSPQLDTLIKIIDALDLKIAIHDSNFGFKTIDDETYQQLVDDFHQFYEEDTNETTESYSTLESGGGLSNEDKKYEYSC